MRLHRKGLAAVGRLRRPGALAAASDGAAAIEFALIVPVFLLLLIGTFDIGQMAYAKAVLDGAVTNAARSSSLETADTSSADAKVNAIIGPILPGVTIESSRTSYFDFADIGRPEQWNDANNNGLCDNDENFTDENLNGEWDADVGVSGNGGAGDVVIYRVSATYEPIFAIPLLTKRGSMRTLTATAVKKNQPFADQNGYGSEVGVCS